VFGEVFNLRAGRARVWFELRDERGALPCSMWRKDFDALVAPLADGQRVVAAGGCDYYPGSRAASPSFSFAVTEVRVAGEGDLLAQLDRLRRALHAEGLFEPQKRLERPALPRCIGVVTGEGGKARDDVLAGLRRRGWAGRVVWAFAPVQDRHAAPAVTRALQDLAACEDVEVIIVARGGGSLADLFAFCDETLCRTVALLRVPVIASVGHHADRTLIDDVAAVSCSTPTHAAEAAVPVDCAAARARLHGLATRLERQGRRAIVERARTLARLSRAPADHVARHRTRLHQHLRELRASARRGVATERRQLAARTLALERKATANVAGVERGAARAHADAAALVRSQDAARARRAQTIERLRLALDAHDPQRTLERGYALVEDAAGAPVTSADAAQREARLTLRMADGTLPVRPEGRR
jgi:exodeoxyribonuclease VII large subunit